MPSAERTRFSISAQAVGHAAGILGPLEYAPLAGEAAPLVLGDHRRPDRIAGSAGRIRRDHPLRASAVMIGQGANRPGAGLGRLPLGQVVGEDIHLFVKGAATRSRRPSNLEEDRPGEDAAIDGDVYRKRWVEFGRRTTVIALVELGEPDALRAGALAKVIAGEDPRRDPPDLLDKGVDGIVAAARLALGRPCGSLSRSSWHQDTSGQSGQYSRFTPLRESGQRSRTSKIQYEKTGNSPSSAALEQC